MPTFDADSATCHVFAFKEGLLSRAGHDVKLEVTLFEVKVEPGRVVGTFDAHTVRSVCAMKAGVEDPGALSDRDKRTIDGYVRDDILQASRYPEIRFESSAIEVAGDGARLSGTLTLHGRSKPLVLEARKQGERWVCRTRVRQPDFGIKPFSALLGALKIQPEIEVEVALPAVPLT